MRKNNESPIVKSRSKSWITPLFTFFVVAVPALIFWIFFSNDFGLDEKFKMVFTWWAKLLIAFAFVIGTFLITLLCVYVKLIPISVFTFSIPVAICFMTIFATDSLVPWARALIVIPFFALIIPIAILTKKIEMKQIIKEKIKEKKENEKIIGHKK